MMRYRKSGIWGSGCIRVFVSVVGLWLSLPFAYAGDELNWYRGQLHSHTYWSDGRGFPEQAIDAYKQRGYAFLSITDHNRFADDSNQWREVDAEEGSWPPKVTQAIYNNYFQAYGKEWVETKTEGAKTLVRLKTYSEVKAKFEEPGRFLLMPGLELTQNVCGVALHLNYVNLPTVLPCVKGGDLIKTVNGMKGASELMALNVSEAEKAAAEMQKPFLLTLNHPFWIYYDILPQNILDCPGVRFFEICNGGSSFAPFPQAESYTPEKFWDIVNAFRSIHGEPLLYGIGTDDAHFYDAKRIDDICGVGDAWVMVRAQSLQPESLIAAMRCGDFYASSGVFLEKLEFAAADHALRVCAKAENGVRYRIRFVTTKRGFDPKMTQVECPAENDRPARKIPIYSEDIGRTVKVVEGNEGVYAMEPDDLYVRAVVESDRPSKFTCYFHPKVQTAWTQPYANAKQP